MTLSQASNSEEQIFLKENFKEALVKLFNTACEIPALSEEISHFLGAESPSIVPCISYSIKK